MTRRGRRRAIASLAVLAPWSPLAAAEDLEHEAYGAIVRGDADAKRMALIFTGDQWGEGAAAILDALKQRGLRASFFLTGNFLRKAEFAELIRRMIDEGHYVGPHSDGHLLYAPWAERDKSQVTEEQFTADLQKNLADLRGFGALPDGMPILFVPPFEWYNRDQFEWGRKLGAELVNFTPGVGAQRDYAPEGDPAFVPAKQIYDDILRFADENPRGLRGAIVLLHLGSGRQDPFHPLVGQLCDELVKRGYELVRVDELFKLGVQPPTEDAPPASAGPGRPKFLDRQPSKQDQERPAP
jgi:peptidoglycan/xylan/chitin deacetylase (PgdA/CDA1 family)